MQKEVYKPRKRENYFNEKGSAIVIALMVLTLLLAFVALSLSRTATEATIANNDSLDTKTFNAAQAGLEDATRSFANKVEIRLTPSAQDLIDIQNAPVPDFSSRYNFTKNIRQTRDSFPYILQAGDFQGLYSLRDEWEIDVTAEEINSGVQSRLRRQFFNDRIPIFQFGAFYNDDLELNRPPLFVFGGRVHTNGNLFISATPKQDYNAGIYFKSKLTVVGEVVNDVWKTGKVLTDPFDTNGDIYIQNTTNNDMQLETGKSSVNCTSSTGGGVLVDPIHNIDPSIPAFPYPTCTANPAWDSYSQKFEGNLITHSNELRLPIEKIPLDLIEIIRRGKNIGDKANLGTTFGNVTGANQDSVIVAKERFANKPGLRVSLADSKDKLPGCATAGANPCGVQLDAALGSSLGYKPLPMTDGYQATALNGNRFHVDGREVWIKIETVYLDIDSGVPITRDVTEDILSLGVTEHIQTDGNFKIENYTADTDSRSIIKLQRYSMPGTTVNDVYGSFISTRSAASKTQNFVIRYDNVKGNDKTNCPNNCTAANSFAPTYKNSGVSSSTNEIAHYKLATFNNWAADQGVVIVPFPIKIFDTREGARNDANTLSNGYVFRNGVMSLIDIDVYNLRRFLNGSFDGLLPTTTGFAASNGNNSLRSTDVPELHGWVLYVSDRRGDNNFDGRYDMEDVDPSNASQQYLEEDLNHNGVIDLDTGSNEAPILDSYITSGYAAVTDQAYYRRGVRLINGQLIPGSYNTTTPTDTKGFTLASENGVYVLGNYNTTGVSLAGSGVTTSDSYQPQNTSEHIPAAVVGDAVTILSNSWTDANSFANPLTETNRVASNTQVRFAMIAGDSVTVRNTSGAVFDGLNGGIHNFIRFLEDWNGKRLNYSGSLINLYNAYNNNGRFKCCNTVYEPPIRDWTFETTFTDANRLPPGTPFVYSISFTGFERMDY